MCSSYPSSVQSQFHLHGSRAQTEAPGNELTSHRFLAGAWWGLDSNPDHWVTKTMLFPVQAESQPFYLNSFFFFFMYLL